MSDIEKIKKEPAAKKPAAKKPAAKKPAAKKDVSIKKDSENVVYLPTLQSYYTSTVIKAMQEKFKYSNVMQVPKILSINLNMGLGDAKNNSKNLYPENFLTLIFFILIYQKT